MVGKLGRDLGFTSGRSVDVLVPKPAQTLAAALRDCEFVEHRDNGKEAL